MQKLKKEPKISNTSLKLLLWVKILLFPKNVDFFAKKCWKQQSKRAFPASICWSWRRLQQVFSIRMLRLPRRLEDVLKISCKTSWRCLVRQKIVTLKTSWRYVLKTSSTHLQRNNLSLPRRLEDVLKLSWRRLAKTIWRHLGRRKIITWRTSWRHLEDMSWRRLENVLKTYLEDVLRTLWRQTKYLLGISVSNKSKCASNKSIFQNLYLTILTRIQNALIRTE